jgi:hypothetical protein
VVEHPRQRYACVGSAGGELLGLRRREVPVVGPGGKLDAKAQALGLAQRRQLLHGLPHLLRQLLVQVVEARRVVVVE